MNSLNFNLYNQTVCFTFLPGCLTGILSLTSPKPIPNFLPSPRLVLFIDFNSIILRDHAKNLCYPKPSLFFPTVYINAMSKFHMLYLQSLYRIWSPLLNYTGNILVPSNDTCYVPLYTSYLSLLISTRYCLPPEFIQSKSQNDFSKTGGRLIYSSV